MNSILQTANMPGLVIKSAKRSRKSKGSTRMTKRPMTNPRIPRDLKYIDTDITTGTTGTVAGVIVPLKLTTVTQDVSQNDRIGALVNLKSLQARWILTGRDGGNGGALAGLFGYRINLFQWHSTSTPGATDILLRSSAFVNTRRYNQDNAQSYIVFYDRSTLEHV